VFHRTTLGNFLGIDPYNTLPWGRVCFEREARSVAAKPAGYSLRYVGIATARIFLAFQCASDERETREAESVEWSWDSESA
jgi:hypothetical protein